MELFQLLVFPGLIFLSVYSFALEYFDRIVYARLQNRQGPPWYQPIADFFKLLGKEVIVPASVSKLWFKLLPVFAYAATLAAFLYIPITSSQSVYPMSGDLIIVLYLLTIPTLCFFLAGYISEGVYSGLGAVRALTQLFAYEVPLFMALLAPAILADSWSFAGIAAYYSAHPLMMLVNIPAFIVAIIAAQGKLERTPFDAPEAETEIVAGAFTEYSGKLLALFRFTVDAELVVVASLLAAVFLPFYASNFIISFILYLLKTVLIVFILAVFKGLMARLRIEQIVAFCWKWLIGIGLLQIVLNVIIKGAF